MIFFRHSTVTTIPAIRAVLSTDLESTIETVPSAVTVNSKVPSACALTVDSTGRTISTGLVAAAVALVVERTFTTEALPVEPVKPLTLTDTFWFAFALAMVRVTVEVSVPSILKSVLFPDVVVPSFA